MRYSVYLDLSLPRTIHQIMRSHSSKLITIYDKLLTLVVEVLVQLKKKYDNTENYKNTVGHFFHGIDDIYLICVYCLLLPYITLYINN